MECSPFLFVSLGNPEYSAVSAAKAVRGSAPAATIAVPPINNSRRVSLVIGRFSSSFSSCEDFQISAALELSGVTTDLINRVLC